MTSTVVIFNADGALAHQWFPVHRAADVTDGPAAVRLLGRSLVVWRSPGGSVVAAHDSCPHSRGVLSEGRVTDGRLVCPKHGWTFGDEGRCVAKPTNLPIAENSHLTTYPCAERYGLIWVSLGSPASDIVDVGCEGSWRRSSTDVSVWRANPIQITEALLSGRGPSEAVAAHVPFSVEWTFKSDDGSTRHRLLSCAPVDGRTSLVASVIWTGGESGDVGLDSVRQAKERSESQWVPLPSIEIDPGEEGTVLGGWKRRFVEAMSPSATE